MPIYTASEAARSLGIPVATVRSWVKGRNYMTRDGEQRFARVIEPPDDSGMLSFRNLVELQVLRALRADHEIPIGTIRRAIRFMQSQLGIEHPLASNKMLHDGKTLFVNFLAAVIDASSGQTVILKALESHLERVEWDGSDPCRVYPFPVRGSCELRAVVLDPYVRHGQPVLNGTRIPLSIVVERHEAGEDVDSIAKDYGRTPHEIETVLNYAA